MITLILCGSLICCANLTPCFGSTGLKGHKDDDNENGYNTPNITFWQSKDDGKINCLVESTNTDVSKEVYINTEDEIKRGKAENGGKGSTFLGSVRDDIPLEYPFDITREVPLTWNSTTDNIPITSSSVYEFSLHAPQRSVVFGVTKFICGTENLCNTTMEPENGHCSVDCDPCQCDDMCHFYGDCCSDLLFMDSPDTPSTPSTYVSCLDEHWTTWGNLTDMWVVSRCPDHPESSTVAKCEHPDNDNPDQATPVSNMRSQVTYRNIFCAQCNGDENVEPWTHQVECRTNMALNTAKSKADLWRLVYADRWCEVESSPPEGVIPRLCFHAEVNSCRDDADPVMKNLCSSFQHTVDYHDHDHLPARYRNIFCALCKGEIFNKSTDFSELSVPFPLTVLLDFNRRTERENTVGEDVVKCEKTKAFDPFSGTCRNVSCSEGRTLAGDDCVEINNAREGFTGYKLQVILKTRNSSDGIADVNLFTEQYIGSVQGELKRFDPVYVPGLIVTLYTNGEIIDLMGDMIIIFGNIPTNSNINTTEIENALMETFSGEFSYNVSGVNVTFSSRLHRCEQPFQYSASYRSISEPIRYQHSTDPIQVFPHCQFNDCLANISYKQIHLSCPFVEYADRFEEVFTFDPVSYNLQFENYSFSISPDEFQCCERVLRICVKTLANIRRFIFGDKSETKAMGDEQDLVLSIVSLVCVSLSLGCLAFTFLVYSVVPKLRTLPGRSSMALMFHLFWAQLFFLTASTRTANVVLCRVFGVVIHYFWTASFTWMFISAYHMYTVFTSIRAYTGDCSKDTKRLAVYSVIGVVVPVVIIASCVTTHLVQHQGADIGYGGDVCFLNNPTAIGVFFVAPLSLMLLLNAVFFTKTILAIRSVPDMREASSKSRKHHVFVYIKLSLLFGFTWIFGIVGAIFRSKVLDYVFNILTGGQGVMLFFAFCVNQRTWDLFKASILGDEKSSSSLGTKRSGNAYTMSMEMKRSTP